MPTPETVAGAPTLLPSALRSELQDHLERVRRLHRRDLARGSRKAPLPDAFKRKAPGVANDWIW